uniref:Uncharacterized protein n=1 Tax=Arundo donax TaxID=35708 RepID=A0A0A8YX01_ARUDO
MLKMCKQCIPQNVQVS